MINACKEYDLPEPVITEEQGGISVTFLKDVYTLEYLKSFHLSDRQTKAVLYIKENEEITNVVYQTLNKISKVVATKRSAGFGKPENYSKDWYNRQGYKIHSTLQRACKGLIRLT